MPGTNYKTPEYRSWRMMKNRCRLDTTKPDYPNYAGRGITVCQEWARSYETFLADVGPRPSLAHTIDRIDNDGSYEPGNVRWATRSEQSRNKRDNHLLTLNGVTHCVAEWADLTGLRAPLIFTRLLKGWTNERTLTTPVRPSRLLLTIDGITRTESQWSRIFGFHRTLLTSRLKRGWTVEDAIATPRSNRWSGRSKRMEPPM